MNDKPSVDRSAAAAPQLSERPRVLTKQLFAVFGGPGAWLAALLIAYALQDVMCDAGAGAGAVRLVVLAVCAVWATVALAAGWTAWRMRGDEDEAAAVARTGERRELMSFVGMLLSGIFLLAIVLTALSPIVVAPC